MFIPFTRFLNVANVQVVCWLFIKIFWEIDTPQNNFFILNTFFAILLNS